MSSAHRSNGFTLLELAAAIALAILVAALAVSAYRTYTVRGQVAAGLMLATDAQVRVVATFRSDGQPLTSIAGPDEKSDGRFLASVAVVNGRIDIRFGRGADGAIAGRVLSLTPYETADLEIVWLCGNKIPERGLQPLGFAGGTAQTVQIPTTIETRYLPQTCR